MQSSARNNDKAIGINEAVIYDILNSEHNAHCVPLRASKVANVYYKGGGVGSEILVGTCEQTQSSRLPPHVNKCMEDLQ